MQGLRKVNILAGLLHLFQMAAVLALSSDFALPVQLPIWQVLLDHHLLLQ